MASFIVFCGGWLCGLVIGCFYGSINAKKKAQDIARMELDPIRTDLERVCKKWERKTGKKLKLR